MKQLNVGKLQVNLEDGAIRYIRYNGVEVLRGIYAAVRDQNWGTVEPVLHNLEITEDHDGLTISFLCEHRQDDIDFVWDGLIRIEENSVLFEFKGKSRSSFLKNRIGFCVLQPMEFAGLPVKVVSVDKVVEGEFPRAISPHQPFFEITRMEYSPISELKVDLVFEGDLFEMEDQRNWTDASYKIYCTPLARPFPEIIREGESIRQTIRIHLTEQGDYSKLETYDPTVRITIGNQIYSRLPEIGFVFTSKEWTEQEIERLAYLPLSNLRIVLDLTTDYWETQLLSAGVVSKRLNCKLELELIVEPNDPVFERLIRLFKEYELLVSRIFPFSPRSFVSDRNVLEVARKFLQTEQLQIPVGGGTRTYYAEFNRATLPLDVMDCAIYSINPQVHAFDDVSLMETISAQAVTACDAYSKTGKPLYIGPITLKPGINPNATKGNGIIPLDEQVDKRQEEPFGAAWTLGSIASLSMKNVRGITYYATHGPIGIVDGERVRPAFAVFRSLPIYAELLEVECSSDSVAVLALRDNNGIALLLANKTDVALEVVIMSGVTRHHIQLESYQFMKIGGINQ